MRNKSVSQHQAPSSRFSQDVLNIEPIQHRVSPCKSVLVTLVEWTRSVSVNSAFQCMSVHAFITELHSHFLRDTICTLWGNLPLESFFARFLNCKCSPPNFPFFFFALCFETVASRKHCFGYNTTSASASVWRTDSSLNKQGNRALLQHIHLSTSFPTSQESSDYQASDIH